MQNAQRRFRKQSFLIGIFRHFLEKQRKKWKISVFSKLTLCVLHYGLTHQQFLEYDLQLLWTNCTLRIFFRNTPFKVNTHHSFHRVQFHQ